MHIIVDLAQIVGALAAVIAIGFAVAAQRSATAAKVEVVAERRRQFELEILREIVRDIDERNSLDQAFRSPGVLHRYKHRIGLLRPGALPFWDSMMFLEDVDQVLELTGLAAEYKTALSKHPVGSRDYQDRQDGFFQRLQVEVNARLVGDIELAIQNRVEADGSGLDPVSSSPEPSEPLGRTWYGRRQPIGYVD